MTGAEQDTRTDLTVELLTWEFKACIDLANTRMAISNERGMNHSSTYQRGFIERINQEVLGACGEMAVCKVLDKFWSPSVNTFHKSPDIWPNIEVRATERTDGSLIVRDNDADDRYYFLVVGEPPRLTVVGYIKGLEAKNPKWIRDPHNHRTAYFVPQCELKKPKRRHAVEVGNNCQESRQVTC